jgi:hypothetical protein
MTSTRRGRARLLALAVAAGLLGASGCASVMQQPDAVARVEQLSGKWQGLISFRGRFDQPMYLTIDPDGRLFAVWGSNQAWGRATVEAGRARFQMSPPPLEGDLKLYGGNGQRALVMQELWGTFIANLSPQR